MPTIYKGISINLGIDIEPKSLKTNKSIDLRLTGCVEDARFMAKIAELNGFKKKLLLNGQVTKTNLMFEIAKAKTQLDLNGILLISFAGHGGQDPEPPPTHEIDGDNEFWALDDEIVLDNQIAFWLKDFQPTQRIVVISDSCHSGTIIDDYIRLVNNHFNDLSNSFAEGERKIDINFALNAMLSVIGLSDGSESNLSKNKKKSLAENLKGVLSKKVSVLFRTPPIEVLNDEEIKERVRQQRNNLAVESGGVNVTFNSLNPNVLAISACQDNEKARDGVVGKDNKSHGLFTKLLMDVLFENGQIGFSPNGEITPISNSGTLTYSDLFSQISAKSQGKGQNPNLEPSNSSLKTQKCFAI